jgi:serine/threonine-protein kinase HipA
MAKRFGLRVPPCLLLELSDGTPAYVVKRFDRYKKGRRIEKRACEDMQQILGGPDKYAGSHEQIARAVRKHCTFYPLELQRLFEVVIFNFAIGNGDAHRKNFSLLTNQDGTIALSPAYDLVSSRLAIPAESEELALTVNGKRNGLRRTDFLVFGESISVAPDYGERQIAKLVNLHRTFTEMIDASLLSSDLRDRLAGILADRLDRLR